MPINLAESLGNQFLEGGWKNILIFGLQIGAALAFGTILYAGFLYLTNSDNASKQKDAIEWIKAAAIGLAILTFGYLILNVVNPNILNTGIIINQQKQDTELKAPSVTNFDFKSQSTPTKTGPAILRD